MTIYLLDDQASSQQPPPPTIFIRRLFSLVFSNSPESQPVEEDVGFCLIQGPKGRGCLWKRLDPETLGRPRVVWLVSTARFHGLAVRAECPFGIGYCPGAILNFQEVHIGLQLFI